jgi:hypothetical protein
MSEYEHEDATPSVPELVSAGRLSNEEQSLWGNLAQQREEISQQRETLIQIPGYTGIDVYARYRLLTGDELEKIARRTMGKKSGAKLSTWERNLTAALDTMADACSGIFYQLAGMDSPKPVTVNGSPVLNYGDPKLQEGLKIPSEVKTTRGVILSMFGNNDLAVSAHAVKLNRWFSDTNRDVDDEFLGEGL